MAFWAFACCGGKPTKPNQPPNTINNNMQTDTATLGGGCFWCTEAVFLEVIGVKQVTSGYSGGHIKNPAYREVCNGNTGHAEVVQIVFDPNVLSYEMLLRVFFGTHDPTTLNQQGADVGTQYRSVILPHSPQQKQTAQKLIDELNTNNTFGSKVVTTIEPFEVFYPAEDYHQDYYNLNQSQPYCRAVISPKVAKFRQQYSHLLKKN